MNKKINELLVKKVEQILQSAGPEIDLESAYNLRSLLGLLKEDNQLFLQLYHAYKHHLPSLDLQHQDEIISYRREETKHSIVFSNKRIELSESLFRDLFISVIGLTREVLPLGTVVELNPAYFKPNPASETPTKAVITERFVAPSGYRSYFPYGGIVYPLGEVKKGAKIHFTDPLIQKIVHLGYRDEVEDAFVYLMKEELIVDNHMHSIEFSKEDMTKVEEEVQLKAGEV